MALIKCPECGKEVSDKAVACVNCGYPIREMLSAEGLCKNTVEQLEQDTIAVHEKGDWYDESTRYDIWLMNANLELNASLSRDEKDCIRMAERRLLKEMLGCQNVSSIMEKSRVSIAKNIDGYQVYQIAEAFLNENVPFTVFDHETLKIAQLAKIRECEPISKELIARHSKPSSESENSSSGELTKRANYNYEKHDITEPSHSVVPQTNAPKCPTCGSTHVTKISNVNRAASVVIWGLMSKKINKSFKCENCGYTW